MRIYSELSGNERGAHARISTTSRELNELEKNPNLAVCLDYQRDGRKRREQAVRNGWGHRIYPLDSRGFGCLVWRPLRDWEYISVISAKLKRDKDRQERIAYRKRFSPASRKWLKTVRHREPNRLIAPRFIADLDYTGDYLRRPISEEEVLLVRGIKDDEALRWLVYADWLDDRDGGPMTRANKSVKLSDLIRSRIHHPLVVQLI